MYYTYTHNIKVAFYAEKPNENPDAGAAPGSLAVGGGHYILYYHLLISHTNLSLFLSLSIYIYIYAHTMNYIYIYICIHVCI